MLGSPDVGHNEFARPLALDTDHGTEGTGRALVFFDALTGGLVFAEHHYGIDLEALELTVDGWMEAEQDGLG